MSDGKRTHLWHIQVKLDTMERTFLNIKNDIENDDNFVTKLRSSIPSKYKWHNIIYK